MVALHNSHAYVTLCEMLQKCTRALSTNQSQRNNVKASYECDQKIILIAYILYNNTFIWLYIVTTHNCHTHATYDMTQCDIGVTLLY